MHGEIELAPDKRGEPRTRSPDGAVAALAARQHGVVSRAQLLALGLSRQAVDRRQAAGRLHAIHRGVYAVGHPLTTRHGRWMAATLAAGPGAVLSHRTAAALHCLTANEPPRPDVTLPHRRASRPDLRHHAAHLPPDERTTADGIPVTTVARTLLDLAAVLPRHRLARALHEAERLRLADATPLATLLARHRGRRGTAALQDLLTDLDAGAQVTRSALEEGFLVFVERFDLPRPRANLRVEGYEADAAWPGARLIVELDGHADHATRRTFERDRARDRILAVAGWQVVRVTHRQLEQEPAGLAADLHALLAAQPSSPPSFLLGP